MDNTNRSTLVERHEIPRAMLDAFARAYHPDGLKGIPVVAAMYLNLDDVPPVIAALFDAVAGDGEVTLSLRSDTVAFDLVVK
jgi:hypothetical protein